MQALGISLFGLIAYAINFAILVVLLRLLLYKPVKQLLETRKQRIADGLDAADRAPRNPPSSAVSSNGSWKRRAVRLRRRPPSWRSRPSTSATRCCRPPSRRPRSSRRAPVRKSSRNGSRRPRSWSGRPAELALAISRKVVGTALDQDAQRRLVEQFVRELGSTNGASGASGNAGESGR